MSNDYDFQVFAADPVLESDTDEDEVFSEIPDPYEYGVGLSASRYSDFLRDEKNLANDCYIQCHSRYGGSEEEGIVSFDISEFVNDDAGDGKISPLQRLVVGINQDEDRPFDYTATVSVDIFADEKYDKDSLVELFSGDNRISVPVTLSSRVVIISSVEPIPDPDDPDRPDETYSRGVRLSHTLNIGKCPGGIGESRMEQIFNLTLAMACYALVNVEAFSRKE